MLHNNRFLSIFNYFDKITAYFASAEFKAQLERIENRKNSKEIKILNTKRNKNCCFD